MTGQIRKNTRFLASKHQSSHLLSITHLNCSCVCNVLTLTFFFEKDSFNFQPPSEANTQETSNNFFDKWLVILVSNTFIVVVLLDLPLLVFDSGLWILDPATQLLLDPAIWQDSVRKYLYPTRCQ